MRSFPFFGTDCALQTSLCETMRMAVAVIARRRFISSNFSCVGRNIRHGGFGVFLKTTNGEIPFRPHGQLYFIFHPAISFSYHHRLSAFGWSEWRVSAAAGLYSSPADAHPAASASKIAVVEVLDS